jgi:predicted nucleic acid-binding protein
MIVVSNATPLISLSLINQLGLLKALYGQVYIPPAVCEEVVTKGKGRPGAQEVAQADWIVVREVPEVARGTVQPRPAALHAGEVETMELALWLQAELVILDERLARKVAKTQGDGSFFSGNRFTLLEGSKINCPAGARSGGVKNLDLGEKTASEGVWGAVGRRV